MQLNCPYENFKKSILPVYIHCDSFPYKWSDFILSKNNLFFGWEICSSWKVVRLSYLKPCWYVLVFFFFNYNSLFFCLAVYQLQQEAPRPKRIICPGEVSTQLFPIHLIKYDEWSALCSYWRAFRVTESWFLLMFKCHQI